MSYTELGEFATQRLPLVPAPYAKRVAHAPRHGASLKRSPAKWFRSVLREIGDVLVGSFLQVASA
jgi:hypothetical protein